MVDNIPLAYVDINYRTAYAFHKARISSAPILGVGSEAVFQPGEGLDDINVLTGVGELVDILKTFYPDSASYIDFTAWNHPVPTERPIPVVSGSLNEVGTSEPEAAIWDKATQVTFTWRTEAFGIFKIVFLDYPVVSFDAQSTLTGFTEGLALSDYVTDVNNWVRGQDNSVPGTFQQISATLNEKLRREYHMV